MTGPQGPRGYTGAPGTPGQAGPKGDKGDKGDSPSIDDRLSATSTNPVQNKVITNAINGIGTDIEQIQGQVNSINKGIAVSTNGDTTVGRNLIIIGKTRLTSGFDKIQVLNLGGKLLDIYWKNLNHTINGVNTYSYVGVLHGYLQNKDQDVYGTYEIEGTSLKLVSVFYNDKEGLKQFVWRSQYNTLTPYKYITDDDLNEIKTDGWEFLGVVAQKTFSKAFTEVKPGKSGIPDGNADVSVVITTYRNALHNNYKTVMDVICKCPQFNLKDTGLNVLLSKVGSRWFFPRMAISKGNMNSTAFNSMMDRLNEQKDNVGISIDEVAIFKDNRGVSGNPGTLNVSGSAAGQVVYDAAEFRVFAVMAELDKDNEGKSIPSTGVHYRISIFHPQSIL